MAEGGWASRSAAVLPSQSCPHEVAHRAYHLGASLRTDSRQGPRRTGRPRLGCRLPGRPVDRRVKGLALHRRAWGARQARTRGLKRISPDLDTRAGALNWSRRDPRVASRRQRMGDRLTRDLERAPISPKPPVYDPFTTVENGTTIGIRRTRKPRALLGGRRSWKARTSAAS